MDLGDFEDKLIARIGTVSTNIKIVSYPNNFDTYISQLTHPGGAILTVWQGSGWNLPEPNKVKRLSQKALYNWQFTVINKNLKLNKNQYGIYERIEEIRTNLSGFTPDGFDDAGVLFPVSAGFLEKRNAFYVYQITMAHEIEESEA